MPVEMILMEQFRAPAHPAAERTIRVGLAESRAVVRRGLIRMAQSADDVVVVGEASDRKEVLRLVEDQGPSAGSLEPDVLILDTDLPDVGGFEVARRVVAEHPSLGLVMLGAAEDWRGVEEAIQAGARGYVARSDAPNSLVDTVRTVGAGGDALSGHRAWLAMREAPLPRRRPRGSLLTERQVEVLRALRHAADDETASHALGISPATLRTHTRRIAARLALGEDGEPRVWATSHRFVIGRGADFVGIWDLDRVGPPIERYCAELETRAEFRLEQLRTSAGWRVRLSPLVERTRKILALEVRH